MLPLSSEHSLKRYIKKKNIVNPCKTCIVQACCSRICDEFEIYQTDYNDAKANIYFARVTIYFGATVLSIFLFVFAADIFHFEDRNMISIPYLLCIFGFAALSVYQIFFPKDIDYCNEPYL